MCTVSSEQYPEVAVAKSLTVLHVHLNCRSVGRLAHPQVKILPLPGLEEKHIVAVIQLSKFVQLV